MAETIYSYNVSTDFPGSAVNVAKLAAEIRASAILTALERIDKTGYDLDIVFKAALSAGDKTLLDGDVTGPAGGLIAAHDNTASPTGEASRDIHNNLLVASHLAIGGGLRKITHNFCDKTTWWMESSEHTAQPCTTGDATIYTITGHDSLIDLRHGKLTFEDDITTATVSPGGGGTMTNLVPTVLVDAVPLALSLEDDNIDGDRYTIDYDAGTVTFAVARTGTPAITVTFRKATTSKWTLKPPTDKRYVLEDVEIDVSEDVDFTNAIHTDNFGSHTTLTGGSIVSLLVRRYKNFHDFQAAARRFWGPIPTGFGGTGGVNTSKWTFEWQYARSDEVYNSACYVDLNLDAAKITINRVEISVLGDVPLGGSFLTMTFYGQEASETNGA